MRKVKSLLAAILCVFVSTLCVACEDVDAEADKNLKNAGQIVGVAVFQNSELNEVWDYMCENPASANSLILTKDGKIVYSEDGDIEHLFFAYSSGLTEDDGENGYITNTTIGDFEINENELVAEMEVYPGTQEFLVYVIVKTQEKYVLRFAKKIENFTEEEKLVELVVENLDVDKLKLTVSRNLTINKEYKNTGNRVIC